MLHDSYQVYPSKKITSLTSKTCAIRFNIFFTSTEFLLKNSLRGCTIPPYYEISFSTEIKMAISIYQIPSYTILCN